MNIRIIFIIIGLFVFSCAVKAQILTDTIYYDAQWSICEKPIARYYRIGTLEKQDYWFFSGKVRDYYINGKLQMEGQYTSRGIKAGLFTFYYPDGKIKKQGNMRADMMIGLWSYYKQDGSVYCQLSCLDNNYFLPFLLLDSHGDTLVKEGTGKFVVNTDNLPDIFSKSPGYGIKGSCLQNTKEGKWWYYSFVPDYHLIGNETYKSGIFKSGEFLDEDNVMQYTNGPVNVVDLSDIKFEATEHFQLEKIFTQDKSNAESQIEALDFLSKKGIPTIDARRISSRNNIHTFLELCRLAIDPESFWSPGAMNYYRNNNEIDTTSAASVFLIDYIIQSDAREIDGQVFSPITPVAKKSLQVDFTLEPDGFLSNIIAKGNIARYDVEHLVYYLERLTNLVIEKRGDSMIRKNDHFYLFVRSNEFKYRKNNFVLSRLILSTQPESETKDNFKPENFRIVENGREVKIIF